LFVQVILVNLVAEAEPRDQKGPLLLVWKFKEVALCHPELPLVHLRRGNFAVLPLSAVFRRSHIVPISKMGMRQVSSSSTSLEKQPVFATHFLVNTSVYERVSGPEDRRVYLSCPNCTTPTEQPAEEGALVVCGTCGESFEWL